MCRAGNEPDIPVQRQPKISWPPEPMKTDNYQAQISVLGRLRDIN